MYVYVFVCVCVCVLSYNKRVTGKFNSNMQGTGKELWCVSFRSKNIYMTTYKNGANKGRVSENIAMRDEYSKAALLQLRIARCVARKFDHPQGD